ncbi:MAG: M16 family metallopeptidase [Vulcanimicrobiota bacterium]
MSRWQMQNGLAVRLASYHAIPYVVLALALPAGTAQEPPEQAGLASLTSALLDRGCGQLDRDQVAEAIDSRGARLHVRQGRDACTFELHVLSEDLDWGFAMLADLVRRPHLEAEEFSKLKKEALGAAQAREGEPRDRVLELFGRALMAEHPYGRPVDGTTATLPGLKVGAVRDFFARHYGPRGSILSLAGDLDQARAEALCERHFGDWAVVNHYRLADDAPFLEHPALATESKPIEQAKVVMGFPSVRRDDADYYAVLVLNQLFGGAFRSRLTRRIRSSEGLAYSVGSGFSAGRCRGLFRVSLQTRNDFANRAIKAVYEEMDRFRHEPVPASELEEAQKGLVLAYPLDVDTCPKIAARGIETELYGLPEDRLEDYSRGVWAVTADEVARVANRLFVPERSAVALVADLELAVPEGFAGWVAPANGPVGEAPEAVEIPAPPRGGQSPSLTTRGQVQETNLTNGMRLLVLENHKAPVASVQLFYRVGSRNEPEGKSGLSHMLEHMMFRGSPRYPDGRFDQLLALHGGNNNAFTTEDFTAYYVNIASDAAWLALDLEADRMRALTFKEDDFQREREVVAEERRLRTEDSPSGLMFEQMSATAFAAHPYRRPVIGWMSDILGYTSADLLDHHRRFYCPNNAILVVTGDVEAARVADWAHSLFGDIPAQPPVEPVITREPAQLGPKRYQVNKEAGYGSIMLGYHVPNLSHPDRYALELLSNILAEGSSSRLTRELVLDRELALNAWSYYDPVIFDPGLFYIGVEYSLEQDPEEVIEAVEGILEGLKTEPVEAEELAKVRRQWQADYIMKQDDAEELATLVGSYAAVDDWTHIETDLERMESVTPEALTEVAGRYLDQTNQTLGQLIPQD